jgi:glutamate/tyrosine decarboxylase-like PLP-dependent enzyme
MQAINHDMIKTLTAGPFIVVGYASSDGTVAHKKMRIIGRDGYLKLVQESLDQLPDAYQALVTETMANPANKFTGEMMCQAGESLTASLKKKLEDKEQTPESTSQIHPAIGYCDNKLDHFIVLRLEQMDETITHAPEAKVKKASMTGFKDLLEAKLPIHRYVHRINLYPGKYVDVQPA